MLTWRDPVPLLISRLKKIKFVKKRFFFYNMKKYAYLCRDFNTLLRL
jgi:hypothetical protein